MIRLAGQHITGAPPTARVVTSAYSRVWIIGRTLAGDRRDQRAAHTLMTHYSLTSLTGRHPSFPAGCTPGKPKTYPTPKDGPGFLAALAVALKDNPPPVRDSTLLARLRPYGIGAGLAPDQAGLDPATLNALYQGVAAKATTLLQEAKASALVGAEQAAG